MAKVRSMKLLYSIPVRFDERDCEEECSNEERAGNDPEPSDPSSATDVPRRQAAVVLNVPIVARRHHPRVPNQHNR